MKINAHNSDAQVYRFTPVRAQALSEVGASAQLDQRLISSETSFFSELHHAMEKMPSRHMGGAESPHGNAAAAANAGVRDLQRVIDALLIEL